MCGITGFVDFTNKSNSQILNQMSGSLAHRGPDGQGTWLHQFESGQVGLGHRRLSIIDLSTSASQPMSYDGLHLVFNGEIYNYIAIRDQLIALGHKFETQSDTEVILHAWRQWGEDAIKQWRGMFAIVLYDQKLDELICIRDRAGVKPFYYYQHNGLFLFGSELKSFLPHPGFHKEINPDAVASFLQYGYVAWPHCIYNNTFKLAPGHLLRLDLKTKSSQIKSYWNVYDYYDKPRLHISLPEAIEETERILQQSFQYRMVADVPVGVFLSGGYDSTCVTTLLQQNSTERIKTFTIGSVDNKLDEAPYAKVIASRLGTDHTEYYCSAAEALAIIPELPEFYDEPFADSSAIPTMLVSRLARLQVTVALSADAGDEIFAGYNRYDYITRYGNKIAAIPAPLRQTLVYAMDRISSERIPYLRNTHNFHGRYDKFRNLLRNPSPAELLKNLTLVFTDDEIGRLFTKPVTELRTAHQTSKLDEGYDALSYMMAVDYQTYLVDDILQKVDRATMSTGLEGREPFLDQHIIEWAAQLPSEYKYHQKQKKYILKQIVHKYIPKEMMDRPKMGFAIPIESWLSKELKPLVKLYLSEERIGKHGLFNANAVTHIVNQFYAGRKEKHLQIWYLLMFEMWYEKWMINE
ncbi:asparagine synthase (glutamine-hydrolyzing) [Mucilaginibacter sp. Bleaf8]|uniref:asparagine synthase (glutamine-hydrolyzing) n=1 Tax=Mucilaginibacter sp. Bleaf8 TaxID=2834430 RepID=UPI001BCED3F1|nr:asparagine synthase (glutamine-hydrolyzing) [Mucilaginibacter sp. Bleaf8]MBS7563843.1 asparagine synthase (glutamine-hydrolyzing) [Mucilaginibacter sp. Bleaf8]